MRSGVMVAAAYRAHQRVNGIERKPKNFGDVANRAFSPVRDNFGHERCAPASVSVVNVLDNLLPALMLKVDIDIRRLLPLLAYKTRKQQIDALRVDRGNAQAVAHS